MDETKINAEDIEIAEIRLECLKMAAEYSDDPKKVLLQAQILYDWVMNVESSKE